MLFIDGEQRGEIDNREGAQRIDLGLLPEGAHSFELQNVVPYCINFYRMARPMPMADESCVGEFFVATDRTYKLFAQHLNGSNSCRFD